MRRRRRCARQSSNRWSNSIHSRIGKPETYRPLAILLSQPGSDEILGGLYGLTAFSYLHVDLLFVPESMPGIGIGRRLMTQAEAEAARRPTGELTPAKFAHDWSRSHADTGFAVNSNAADRVAPRAIGGFALLPARHPRDHALDRRAIVWVGRRSAGRK